VRISVVVPCFNEERHIAACLEALVAQDYPRDAFEIILVDNNSTDRSVEIARRCPGVQVLHEPVQGDYASRNLGIRVATGDVIAFTDADTAPFPDWLQSIADIMQDDRIDIIVGKLEFASDSRALRMMEDYEAEKSSFIFSGDIPEIYMGYTCNMAVRKSIFDRLGPFEPVQRNADVVLVRRVADAFSCSAVVYGETVRVLRLEVPSFRAFLEKQRVYGRDLPRYAALANARPLNTRERLGVYRATVRNRGLSLPAALYLFSLLAVGAVSYDAASWLRKLSPHRTGNPPERGVRGE
jgi:glycosyltransferase involved in cell wall biosynthesis